MPIYEFKCNKCKKDTEILINFSAFNAYEAGKNADVVIVGMCSNKKCGAFLHKQDQQINFAGYVTMISPVTTVKRKYSNKAGGPKPIIDGKIRNDMKMPTQV
jgi:predicted nucleic acid-binding Zn ribbon protein